MTTIYQNWATKDIECPRRLINRLVVPNEWKEGEGCPYTVFDLSEEGLSFGLLVLPMTFPSTSSLSNIEKSGDLGIGFNLISA